MFCSSLFSSTLRCVGALGVQHLAAQRQDRLRAPIAPLLGGAAGAVALDEEQLALAGIGARAVGELARQVQAVADRRLAQHLLRSPRGSPRARARPVMMRAHDRVGRAARS